VRSPQIVSFPTFNSVFLLANQGRLAKHGMIFVPSQSMKNVFLLWLFCCISGWAFGQSDSSNASLSNQNIQFAPGLEGQISSFKEEQRNQFYKGYSVQILSASGPTALQDLAGMKQSFLRLHPNVPVNEIWEAPNWKLRVGEFKSKFNAAVYRQYLLSDFPRAYVVEGEIRKRSKR